MSLPSFGGDPIWEFGMSEEKRSESVSVASTRPWAIAIRIAVSVSGLAFGWFLAHL